jgi:hypothetical protein
VKEEVSKGGGVDDLLKLVTNPITNLTRPWQKSLLCVSWSVDNLDATGLLQVMYTYLWVISYMLFSYIIADMDNFVEN